MAGAQRSCCMATMCFWRRMAILCSGSIRLYRSRPTPFWWRIWPTITGRRCRCWRDEAVWDEKELHKARRDEAGGARLHAGGADCCDFPDPGGAERGRSEGGAGAATGARGGGDPPGEPVCAGDPAVLPEDGDVSGYDGGVREDE